MLSRPMRSRSQPANALSDLIASSVTGVFNFFFGLRSMTTSFSSSAFGSAYGAEAISATSVSAIDLEIFAIEACRLNAAANGVTLELEEADPIGTDGGWDVVLVGDLWYEPELAARMAPWLRELAGRGAAVLTGDPGRAHLPVTGLEELARYEVPTSEDLEDVTTKTVRVLRLIS